MLSMRVEITMTLTFVRDEIHLYYSSGDAAIPGMSCRVLVRIVASSDGNQPTITNLAQPPPTAFVVCTIYLAMSLSQYDRSHN